MIFRAELSQNRQFRIIFENQAPNPVRNSRKLPHGNAKKRIFGPKASRGSMKFWLQLLYDNNVYRTAIIHKQIFRSK